MQCKKQMKMKIKINIVTFKFLEHDTKTLDFFSPDIYSFYMTVRQIGGISSTAQCGSYVLKTYELTVPGSRANAFRYH